MLFVVLGVGGAALAGSWLLKLISTLESLKAYTIGSWWQTVTCRRRMACQILPLLML